MLVRVGRSVAARRWPAREGRERAGFPEATQALHRRRWRAPRRSKCDRGEEERAGRQWRANDGSSPTPAGNKPQLGCREMLVGLIGPVSHQEGDTVRPAPNEEAV